jgi:hypothetical protein
MEQNTTLAYHIRIFRALLKEDSDKAQAYLDGFINEPGLKEVAKRLIDAKQRPISRQTWFQRISKSLFIDHIYMI